MVLQVLFDGKRVLTERRSKDSEIPCTGELPLHFAAADFLPAVSSCLRIGFPVVDKKLDSP